MSDRLNSGEFLVREDVNTEGSRRTSENGQYFLVLQADGNLVLKRTSDEQVLWASGTNKKAVKHAIMQLDGRFVIKDFDDAHLWAAGSAGKSDAFLVVQNDANVVIYQLNTPLWATNTAGRG